MTAENFLGELPAGWQSRRLRTLGSFSKGFGGSKEDNCEAGVPVVRYGDLYTTFDTVITRPVAYVDDDVSARYATLRFGTLVLTASGEDPEEIGKAALSQLSGRVVVGGDAILFSPDAEIDGLFLSYALQSAPLRAQKAMRSTGFTVVHITAGRLKTLMLPCPSIERQRAIADFLDRETAKIDVLIEKQNELIDLLRERRGALILRGVIGADAVLRKSATLGWTSDVPVRWSVQPVSYVADVTLGKMVTSSQPSPQSDLRPYLRAANVQPDGQTAFDDLNEMWFTPTEAAELTIRRGDVVVVEGGQGGFGRAAWVREDLPGVGFQNSINRLRPRASDGRYLAYSLIAVRATGFMHAYCDTVSMPHLTSEKLSRIRLAIPPLHAQREIADHLDRETAKIDALIAKAQEFVELARERRAALITAAVTGQIDVTQKAA